jgi:hypothetical protein
MDVALIEHALTAGWLAGVTLREYFKTVISRSGY